MTTPIILITGQAGSGKDTVAAYIAEKYNGVCIAQADPMKRFAKAVYAFTDDQLWGPSSSRNAMDGRYPYSTDEWDAAWLRFRDAASNWIDDVLPELDAIGQSNAYVALVQWFKDMRNSTTEGRLLTPRRVLQTLGTEFGRMFSQNMWTDYAMRTAKALLGGGFTYDRATGLTKGSANPSWVIITDGRFRNELVNVLMAGGNVVKVESTRDDSASVEAAGVKGHASEAEQKAIPEHFYTSVLENDFSGLENLYNVVDSLMFSYTVPPSRYSVGLCDTLDEMGATHVR